MQGKSDFEAIEGFRGDAFFKQALDIGVLPSSPTLRQRLDAQADGIAVHTGAMIEALLLGHRPDYGVLPCGWLPVDIDTFAMLRMDNSGTAKEGVGRTYAGAYLCRGRRVLPAGGLPGLVWVLPGAVVAPGDRKSTRLNSSHQ